MLKFIPVDAAREILAAHTRQVGTETVSLEDSLGRITARGIRAPLDMPNFRKSPFDGYCLVSGWSRGASRENPVRLEVGGILPAGGPGVEPRPAAYKIMTGAEVPELFDCVIKKEETDQGSQEVALFRELRHEENIIRIGEDVARGRIVLEEGMRITPGAIAMLSSLGVDKVQVYRRPKVALITTGDEIRELGEALSRGAVYNSNRYAITAMLTELGAETRYLGIASDDKEALRYLFRTALGDCDLLLTTGGVSVGDFDYIQEIYDDLGIEKLFWGVRMKPGTPVLAGRVGETLVLSLPGSPAASLITFEVLAAPVVRRMGGQARPEKQEHKGILVEGFAKPSDIPRFLRVRVEGGEQGYRLFLSGKQNAGVLSSMIGYDALALVEKLDAPVGAGEILSFRFSGEEDR